MKKKPSKMGGQAKGSGRLDPFHSVYIMRKRERESRVCVCVHYIAHCVRVK